MHRLEIAEVKEYSYEFPDQGPLSDPKVKAEVLSLLPPCNDKRVSFYLSGTDRCFANAIRRTAISEVPAVSLLLELADIETDEEFILPHQLMNRVAMIPIDQDLAPGTVFTLNVSNPSGSSRELDVTSGDLVPEKPMRGTPWAPTFRLAWLRPRKKLTLKKVTVVAGTGYMHAAFSNTASFTWHEVDYCNAEYLGAQGRTHIAYLRSQDLIDLMKSKDVLVAGRLKGSKLTPRDLPRLQILVVPNAEHLAICKPSNRPEYDSYDLVIQNAKPNVPVDPHDVSSFVRNWSGLVVEPSEYHLSFRTFGNIHPCELLARACQNLAERLNEVKAGCYLNEEESNKVTITKDGEITTFKIMEESYTLGPLITMAMLKAEPTIPNVRSEVEQAQTRILHQKVWHADPLTLMSNVCQDLSEHFTRLAEEFRSYLNREAKAAQPAKNPKGKAKKGKGEDVEDVEVQVEEDPRGAGFEELLSADSPRARSIRNETS